MRHVQLYLPEERTDVLNQLDERNVDYVRTPTVSGEGELVQFPLPDEAVDDVLRELSDRGLSNDAYTVVDESSTATAPNLDQLQSTFAAEPSGEFAGERLHDRAVELSPNRLTFVVMSLLSAIIVAGGLLRNSAAAVAGAMVIAPYFDTALSVSTGIVTDDRFLFLDGLKYLLTGILVSVAGAMTVGVVGRTFELVPSTLALSHLAEVSIFLTPTLLSVGIALAAGAAGAVSFATSTNVGLSGVAIAAAIVPAAGVVGLGFAWGSLALVTGATALLLVNVVAVHAAAVPVLYLFHEGESPSVDPWTSVTSAVDEPRVLAAVLALLLVTGTAGVATVQHATFNRAATDAIDDVLDRPAYDHLATASVHTEYAGLLTTSGPALVRVSVITAEATTYPGLVSAFESRIERATGRDVVVFVHFSVYYQGTQTTADDPAPAEPRLASGAAVPIPTGDRVAGSRTDRRPPPRTRLKLPRL